MTDKSPEVQDELQGEEQAKPASKRRLGVLSYHQETAGRGPMIYGLLLILPLLLFALLWSFLAPLSAASIADGHVVLNLNRKQVQHLEGGLIEAIHVREGQLVERDEPLFTIKDLSQRVQVNTLYDQIATNRALFQRLLAEQRGAPELIFNDLSKDIELSDEKRVALEAMQQDIFKSRRENLNNQLDLIASQKLQTQSEIKGLEARLTSYTKQLSLNRQDHDELNTLTSRQLTTKNRVRELAKRIVELEGNMASTEAELARQKEALIGLDQQALSVQSEYQQNVLDELQKTDLALKEMQHQLLSIEDSLERTLVRAPVSGRVMDIQVHTQQAVIAPGARLLDIVPQNDQLIVEAKLKPQDIDLVKVGTTTKVVLAAYRAKKVPKLDGEVISVSGDILVDEATQMPYFLTRVRLDQDVFRKLKEEIKLTPGMPVQAFFIEGERTLADYLLTPITDATYRAFREE